MEERRIKGEEGKKRKKREKTKRVCFYLGIMCILDS